LSVANEGLRERIDTLEAALSSMRKRFDSSNKKYKELSREHSKCSAKRKIMFLYR
jgi:chaperonin cofactor prefoldin